MGVLQDTQDSAQTPHTCHPKLDPSLSIPNPQQVKYAAHNHTFITKATCVGTGSQPTLRTTTPPTACILARSEELASSSQQPTRQPDLKSGQPQITQSWQARQAVPESRCMLQQEHCLEGVVWVHAAGTRWQYQVKCWHKLRVLRQLKFQHNATSSTLQVCRRSNATR
jgi:hypothetical protein